MKTDRKSTRRRRVRVHIARKRRKAIDKATQVVTGLPQTPGNTSRRGLFQRGLAYGAGVTTCTVLGSLLTWWIGQGFPLPHFHH